MKLRLLLLCLWLAAGAAWSLEPQELAQQARPSVVGLARLGPGGSDLGSGTGFFVTEHWLVTNYHVLRGAASLKARLSTGLEVAVAGVRKADPGHDLAVLEVQGGPYRALSLGESTSVRVGDPLVMIGAPAGLDLTVSKGIVSNLHENGIPAEKGDEEGTAVAAWGLQTDAAMSPGSSGSPMLNSQGEVIGVAVGQSLEGQALNFGIPVHFLRELLAGIDPKAPPTPLGAGGAGRSVLENLAISAAFFAALGVLGWGWPRLAAWRQKRPRPLQGKRPF